VIAADTNLFLYALNADAPEHRGARAFLAENLDNPDFVLCELMLVELYVLPRTLAPGAPA
jgi:predicted nucleic acid-binding protein